MTEWNSLSSVIRILKRNKRCQNSQLVVQHNKDTNAVNLSTIVFRCSIKESIGRARRKLEFDTSVNFDTQFFCRFIHGFHPEIIKLFQT